MPATANGLEGILIEGETQMNYGFKISTSLHLRKHDMLPIIHKVVDNTTATLVAEIGRAHV